MRSIHKDGGQDVIPRPSAADPDWRPAQLGVMALAPQAIMARRILKATIEEARF
jgi:hypothetical protein